MFRLLVVHLLYACVQVLFFCLRAGMHALVQTDMQHTHNDLSTARHVSRSAAGRNGDRNMATKHRQSIWQEW